MKRLLINGDPGLRQGGVIDHEGEELVCFSVTRNGDYHGPERVQLSCIVGDRSELEDFQSRSFVPHFLDTEAVAADAVTVVEESGELVA